MSTGVSCFEYFFPEKSEIEETEISLKGYHFSQVLGFI